jgi:hypothetical protein
MEKQNRPAEVTILVPSECFRIRQVHLEHLNDPNYDFDLRRSSDGGESRSGLSYGDGTTSDSAIEFDE